MRYPPRSWDPVPGSNFDETIPTVTDILRGPRPAPNAPAAPNAPNVPRRFIRDENIKQEWVHFDLDPQNGTYAPIIPTLVEFTGFFSYPSYWLTVP